jgi:ribosomal protein L11 methyltransferase
MVVSTDGLSNLQSPSVSGRRREVQISTLVMKLLDSTPAHRLTPVALTRTLHSHHPHLTRRVIRQAIQSLVEHGQLTYSERFGRTYIEFNYYRAVPITDRITLLPPHCTPPKRPGAVLVKLNSGISFGMGDHPTTRISLRGVEWAMTRLSTACKSRSLSVLDIGTGSGVLAIASTKLGAARAFGLDVDPLACHEARENVAINRLKSHISIHETTLDRFDAVRCELIVANLRPPTLKQIIPLLGRCSSSPACWLFSGFRDEEAPGIGAFISRMGCAVIWQRCEDGWAGMVVAPKDQTGIFLK